MKDKMRNASKRTLALFAAALVALGAGGILTARAALNIVSDTFDAGLEMAKKMDVTILEGKGDDVVDAGASAVVLNALQGADGKQVNMSPGKVYDETLAVKNNSGRPMYIRMVVRKYWLDQDGNKGTNIEIPLDPSLIELGYSGRGFNSDDWIKSDSESTAECDVYYYKSVLTDTTSPLFDGVSVSKDISDKYTTSTEEKNGKTVITYEYQYDDCSVCLEVEAQAVQTHNAEEAIKSIWGVDVTISDGNIMSVK